MKNRQIASFSVSAIGLGCMNLSHAYGAPVSAQQGERVLLSAFDQGVTFFDTAALYGFGSNETLLGQVMKPHRNRFTLASKCGMQGVEQSDGSKVRVIDGRPETIKKTCEDSLRRLQTEVIDLYYLHRVDPKVPIEETIGAMGRLVEQGKVRHIGICEAGAQTLQRAHSEHPITALQTEYSLWWRQAGEDMLGLCRQLGIGFVGYSPLGRGLLTGDIQRFEDLAPSDRRRIHPRFKGENLQRNLALVRRMEAMAQPLGLSCAQLALAWAAAQGQDIVPLTGTQRLKYVEQGVAALTLPLAATQCAELEAIFSPEAVSGERYPVEMLKDLGI